MKNFIRIPRLKFSLKILHYRYDEPKVQVWKAFIILYIGYGSGENLRKYGSKLRTFDDIIRKKIE